MKRLLVTCILAIAAVAFGVEEGRASSASSADNCYECEAFSFYAIYDGIGNWYSGEQCVSASALYGFDFCLEDFNPGNPQFGEEPTWTCRARRLDPTAQCAGQGNGGAESLVASSIGLDGRLATPRSRLVAREGEQEIRNCDQFLLARTLLTDEEKSLRFGLSAVAF